LASEPAEVRRPARDLEPHEIGTQEPFENLAPPRKLQEQLATLAAEKLNVPRDRIVCALRQIYDRDDPTTTMSFIDAAVLAEARYGTLSAAGWYKPPPGIGGTFKGAGVGPTPAYSYQAAVAEVTVDRATGRLTVDRIVTAHDCGRALNPANVEGQVEGAAYMGYGEAIGEEQVFRGGLHKKPSLLDYKIPTSLIDAEGPYGAKEAGEGPLNPVIPAIANAVFDAIGVRFDETPITPEKILDALAKKKDRVGPTGLASSTDAKAALRRLSASTDARERKRDA